MLPLLKRECQSSLQLEMWQATATSMQLCIWLWKQQCVQKQMLVELQHATVMLMQPYQRLLLHAFLLLLLATNKRQPAQIGTTLSDIYNGTAAAMLETKCTTYCCCCSL
jgi:hypothetical protein